MLKRNIARVEPTKNPDMSFKAFIAILEKKNNADIVINDTNCATKNLLVTQTLVTVCVLRIRATNDMHLVDARRQSADF